MLLYYDTHTRTRNDFLHIIIYDVSEVVELISNPCCSWFLFCIAWENGNMIIKLHNALYGEQLLQSQLFID